MNQKRDTESVRRFGIEIYGIRKRVARILVNLCTVAGQKNGHLVQINPDLIPAVGLGLVKDDLQAEMQVRDIDVVDVFFCTVSRHAEVTNDLAGVHVFTLVQIAVRVSPPQMGIIIVSFPVK